PPPLPARQAPPRPVPSFTAAVIIPVYRHSARLPEAIESVLAQDGAERIATVIVDDGCPFEETEIVGETYALAYDSVFYLRKPNGGLSSARNAGIAFVLSAFPTVEAVYFLDADNRITPTMMRDTLAFLRANPEIDWVYPNIDKIGIAWNGNYTAPYSRLLHLAFDNICEAGSLVSRRLLDRGIRFDEAMKAGFEDWDFWLQAIGKGCTGRNFPTFGFEYRQRAESMLRDSHRQKQAILDYLHKKHRTLFTPDTLLAWEHEEAPRYAMAQVGSDRFALFTDPDMPGEETDLEGFVTAFWASLAEPDTHGVPPFTLWVQPAHLAALKRLGLCHGALWLMERLADTEPFVALRLERDPARIGVSIDRIDQDNPLAAPPSGWMTRHAVLRDCVLDSADDWARSLRHPVPAPGVMQVTIRGPFSSAELRPPVLSATNALLATLGALREASYRETPRLRWNWRSAYLPDRVARHQLLRQAASAAPVMPRVRRTGSRTIGILLPLAAFGGVEKVAYAMARELKAAGYEVHLFLPCATTYNYFPDNDGLFRTINFLAADYPLWGGQNLFMGHEVMLSHDAEAKLETVLGFLGGLDIVINCQVAPVNAVLGALRRRGTRIIGHWHVIDQTGWGRAAGHPYLALAFEHAYDLMLTCSADLERWLHGMGVPREKLLHIPNAPSYDIPAERLAALLANRRARTRDALHVVYLGRLEQQKGIEWLLAAVTRTRALGLPVVWRVIGSEVIETRDGWTWTDRFLAQGVEVERPLYDSTALADVLAEADVMVLPSRWEGAPLSIIEAQRLGCVPVATDVGAVRELIEDGVDGVLLGPAEGNGVAAALVATIADLATNRTRLTSLAEAGIARRANRGWAESTAPLLDRLESWF
ncbi:MAG TPA: glycosyltransferase, partial [Acetobacteraceae bacterium]|nr:glycosyltransferase [Acetobacteraceae bacterium]